MIANVANSCRSISPNVVQNFSRKCQRAVNVHYLLIEFVPCVQLCHVYFCPSKVSVKLIVVTSTKEYSRQALTRELGVAGEVESKIGEYKNCT